MAIAEIAAGATAGAAVVAGVGQAFTAAAQAFSAWKGAHKGENVGPEAVELTLRLSELFERYAALIDAHTALDAAYKRQLQVNSSLEQRVSELAKEMANLQAFDADAQKYKLVRLGSGTFCFVAEPVAETIKEGPYFCAACFERRQRSIMQRSKSDFHWDTLRCGACGGEIMVPNDIKAEAMVSRGGRIDLDGY